MLYSIRKSWGRKPEDPATQRNLFWDIYGYGPEHVDKGEYIHNYRYFFWGDIIRLSILSDSLCILKSIKADNIYYI